MKKFFVPFVFVVFLLNGCCIYFEANEKAKETSAAFSVEWNDGVGTKISDLRYGSGDYHTYDLYLPPDSSAAKSTHLILYTHGGGWMTGSKEQGDVYCKYFTSKGYVTASINYTLSDGSHDPTISSVNNELLSAVTAIKNEALARGYNLVDMANFGFSAGACQSILYAFKEKENSALPVKFVMDWSGPVSFNPDYWTAEAGVYAPELKLLGMDGSDQGKADMVKKFSGVDCTASMIADGSAQSVWGPISPYTYVSSASVPVLLCFGSYDGIVPPCHQRLLIETLRQYGVTFNVIEFTTSGHGLHYDSDKLEEFKVRADQYCAAYF